MATANVQEMPEEEPVSFDPRSAKIAELAYLKAEKRGFEPGNEWNDWLEAEKEVDTAQGEDI